MPNLQNQEIDYRVEDTDFWYRRSYVYESGASFRESRSKINFLGIPFIHITYGKCPETGRRIAAKGFIAIGRISIGVISIGHLALGVFAIGQAAFGLFFLGQLGIGLAGIGQAACALLFGAGQFATGYVAIGQFAYGHYALGAAAWGDHVWSVKVKDPEAVEFFTNLWHWFSGR